MIRRGCVNGGGKWNLNGVRNFFFEGKIVCVCGKGGGKYLGSIARLLLRLLWQTNVRLIVSSAQNL